MVRLSVFGGLKQCLHLFDAVTAHTGLCLSYHVANAWLVHPRVVLSSLHDLDARVCIQAGARLINHQKLRRLQPIQIDIGSQLTQVFHLLLS